MSFRTELDTLRSLAAGPAELLETPAVRVLARKGYVYKLGTRYGLTVAGREALESCTVGGGQ